MQITLPLVVTLPRKTKKDKICSLGLNWYRNAQFYECNAAKVKFKAIVAAQLLASRQEPLKTPVTFNYRYWFRRKCDVGNFHSVVDKFFLDALVECGVLPEDNCEVVTGSRYEFCGYDKINPRVEIVTDNLTAVQPTNDLLDIGQAGIQWWKSKRPVDWDLETHLTQPRVNCVTKPEKNLATAVAAYLK